ncbi:hypothetical protein PMAYCL1PPCAC_12556 [Pristionchus mayeri]|uniref:Uncharacterized protein n=1 Tax=Pristionchus mayeri TaxID=1317129 RepID=A0AAN4ZKB0_9BILA|nr:hypothetical protein PMAYCL1PPCAC_12556 [Pristionchus mayeri]
MQVFKDSHTVKCDEGTCEMDGGACLMLDHPEIGIHFTCHTRSLQDGACRWKTSKSNYSVRICGCHSEDYCNYSIWPKGSASEVPQPVRPEEAAAGVTDVSVNGVCSPLLSSLLFILSLRFL